MGSFLQNYFGPGTLMDLVSRMWTPGIKGPEPSPQDDPMYLRKIGALYSGPTPQIPTPGVGMAQDQGWQQNDAQTATMKFRKAKKLKEAKGEQWGQPWEDSGR